MDGCKVSSGKFSSLALSVITHRATLSSDFHQLPRKLSANMVMSKPNHELWVQITSGVSSRVVQQKHAGPITQWSSFTVSHLHGQSENTPKTRVKANLVPYNAM